MMQPDWWMQSRGAQLQKAQSLPGKAEPIITSIQSLVRSMTAGQWSEVCISGARLPPPRYEHSIAVFNRKLYVIGGNCSKPLSSLDTFPCCYASSVPIIVITESDTTKCPAHVSFNSTEKEDLRSPTATLADIVSIDAQAPNSSYWSHLAIIDCCHWLDKVRCQEGAGLNGDSHEWSRLANLFQQALTTFLISSDVAVTITISLALLNKKTESTPKVNSRDIETLLQILTSHVSQPSWSFVLGKSYTIFILQVEDISVMYGHLILIH